MIDGSPRCTSRSGLIDEVKASTVDLATAEAMVLDYINEHVKQPKTAPLAGKSSPPTARSSPATCPRWTRFLHYRMTDAARSANCAALSAGISAAAQGWTHRAPMTSTNPSANCGSTVAPRSPQPGPSPAKLHAEAAHENEPRPRCAQGHVVVAAHP